MNCCPTCGQTLPPAELVEGLVLRKGHRVIYDIVKKAGKHGINSTLLFDKLYANDPDGGPLTGKSTLATRVYHLNRRLRPFGQQVRSNLGPFDNVYKLEQIKRVKAKGERVLTPALVDSLRKEYREGRGLPASRRVTQVQLARKYGITQAHVSTLVRFRDRQNAPYWNK